MSYSRLSKRNIFLNDDRNYRNVFFRNRGVMQTYQYSMPRLSYPTNEVLASLTTVTGVWHSTDKLYNISNQYYGSPDYWWVIAWFNKKATEAEFETGEIFYIPLPLSDVLGYF